MSVKVYDDDELNYLLGQQQQKAQAALQLIDDTDFTEVCTSEEIGLAAAKLIKFENCNVVAHTLFMSNTETAKALYNELAYYMER